MPKSTYVPPPQPGVPWPQTPLSREYLAFLGDPEITGLDDVQVSEAIHVAFGHRPGANYGEGRFDE